MIHLCLTMIGIVLLFYLAALYMSAALGILALFLAGIVLLSLAVIVWRMCHLHVTVSIPFLLAQSGQPFDVCLTTQADRTLLGTCALSVCVEAKPRHGRKRVRTWTRATAQTGMPTTVRRAVTLSHAGGYVFRVRRVRVYDWLGWFYLTKWVRADAQVQVLAGIRELAVKLSFAVRNFSGESEIYDDLRGGDEAAEIFQIREYQPGDRLQNIHWKLSAKSEDLIVRERGLAKGCPIVLLIGNKQEKRLKPAQSERFLQLAASVSFALLDAGCPHVVGWYEQRVQDLVRMRVDTEEDFYEWQVQYMGAEPPRAYEDVEARYREKYRGEQFLHILRIEPEQSMYLDGSRWQDNKGLIL